MSDPGAVAVLEATAATAPAEAAPTKAFKGRKLGVGAYLAAVWLIVVVVLAVLAPYLPFVEDSKALPDFKHISATPSLDHWLGTDASGRDIFSRVVYGARISLFIAVITLFLGFLLGGVVGITSGYFRGRFDRVMSAVIDVMLAFPALVLALALIGIFKDPLKGAPIHVVILSLSILSVAPLARITRGVALAFAEREFVMAARTLGAGHFRILRKEILPNVAPPMMAFSLTVMAVIIVAEGGLAFLGLSVSSPTVTWGKLIGEGRPKLDTAPHIALVPSAVMFVTILSLNYLGDVLSAKFAVREGAL